MPHLRGGNNVEGRRLFAMEGAASPKLMAAGLELDRFLHDGNQVRRSAYLVFFLIANHGCSPLLAQVVTNVLDITLDGRDQLIQRIEHARRTQPTRKRQRNRRAVQVARITN